MVHEWMLPLSGIGSRVSQSGHAQGAGGPVVKGPAQQGGAATGGR
jgi:hypothetical protein